MLSPHVRLFVCFVLVHVYLTCSYCLSLYANQVKWYSVFSFTTAFNFTLHFKCSLNPVQRISLQKRTNTFHMPGFVDCFCTLNLPVQFNTRLQNSEGFFFVVANIKLKLFYCRTRLFKNQSMKGEKKSTIIPIHKCTHRTSCNSHNAKKKMIWLFSHLE